MVKLKISECSDLKKKKSITGGISIKREREREGEREREREEEVKVRFGVKLKILHRFLPEIIQRQQQFV